MAARVPLNQIKTNLKTLFDTANTIGAMPIDLSSDMTKRVAKVLKVNPDLIPIQASFFPCVTCYVDEKTPTGVDISVDQLQSKRKADVYVDIVGAVWNNNFKTDTEDPADEDITFLMENVELILRSDATLSGAVRWQIVQNVRYYTAQIGETTHLRAGLLKLKAVVFY